MVEDNKKASDKYTEECNKTLNKHEYNFIKIKKVLGQVLVQTQPSSKDKVDLPKAQDPDTVLPYNNKSPPLVGVNPIKLCGMWNIKHDNSASNLYEFIIKTKIKMETALVLNAFYNNINICINAVTRIR